jgi:hypothetical protein
VIPAVQHLWEKSESNRAASLTYRGFATGWRVGELEIALRILQQEEALCLELGIKDSLQRSYGHQAVILTAWWGTSVRWGFLWWPEWGIEGALVWR